MLILDYSACCQIEVCCTNNNRLLVYDYRVFSESCFPGKYRHVFDLLFQLLLYRHLCSQ